MKKLKMMKLSVQAVELAETMNSHDWMMEIFGAMSVIVNIQ